MASNKDFADRLLEHLVKSIDEGDSVLSHGDTKSKYRKTPKANIELLRKRVEDASSSDELGATLDEIISRLEKNPEEIYKRAEALSSISSETVHGVSVKTEVTPLGTIRTVISETPDSQLLDAVLDLTDAKDRLNRGGDREKRAPEEWKTRAKKIRDHQKAIGTPKFREVAYELFIQELKKDFPEDRRIAHISWDAFKKTYLG